VQITAPMSPGSSGSPVMDAQSGEVLGIATLIYEGGQNLNFAIPAQQIAALMASASSSATVRRAELVRKTGKEVRLVSRNQVGFKYPELINALKLLSAQNIVIDGDTASLDQDGVAQVAMQQGRYVGKLIRRQLAGESEVKPFRYFDKGNMAVVGKGFAILQSGKLRMHGLVAWFAWAAIHIAYLAQPNLRFSVFLQWLWTFLTGERGSQLIVEPAGGQTPTPLKSHPASGDASHSETV